MKVVHTMVRVTALVAALTGSPVYAADTIPAYEEPAQRLLKAATESDFAFKRLTELCDTFGPRFSGTTNLEAAIGWMLREMKADGLQKFAWRGGHGSPLGARHGIP